MESHGHLSGAFRHEEARSGSPPNFLVVTVDDQTLEQFDSRVMPRTTRFFRRHGTTFENALATPPLCCPARAGFLTGQYPQNHGVVTNDNGYSLLQDKENVLPAWLDRAGYRTALVGKYLNGYPALSGVAAPGWDDFIASGDVLGYRDFQVSVNAELRTFGADHYSTTVDAHAAEEVVSSAADENEPFFIWLTLNAPHTVPDGEAPCSGVRAQPETRADYRAVKDLKLEGGPALEERDISDKGRWVQQKGRLSQDIPRLTKSWVCALAALRSVDRSFAELVSKLRESGELGSTLVAYTSDNGLFYGEHGIPDDKQLPYDPALRVPLAIAPPATSDPEPPQTAPALVSNVDLAPTLLDYAGVKPCIARNECRLLDGRSLQPLLAGKKPDWVRGRAIPVTLDADFEYEGFRTQNRLFFELTRDRIGVLPCPEAEFYDLKADPFELENKLGSRSGGLSDRGKRMLERARRLNDCAGTRGDNGCP